MKEINVLTDGNCLFRCISTFLNENLLIADRFKNGRIKARKLDEKENENARSLRFIAVEALNAQKSKYADDIFYNDTDLYKTIDIRIEKMKDNCEFAGLLELKVLSKILKINFNIYVKQNIQYNLVSCVGKKYKKKCSLLLDNEHYNLII